MRIFGEKQVTTYSVRVERDSEGKLTHKPFIVRNVEIDDAYLLTGMEVEVPENATHIFFEGESHKILRREYNVELDTEDIYTDILIKLEQDESDAEIELVALTKAWNEQEITKNERMRLFCDIVGKDPGDVCVEDLAYLFNIPGWSRARYSLKSDFQPKNAPDPKYDGYTIPFQYDHNLKNVIEAAKQTVKQYGFISVLRLKQLAGIRSDTPKMDDEHGWFDVEGWSTEVNTVDMRFWLKLTPVVRFS